MGKSTVEVLREARELISDPSHWTQGALARGIDGKASDVMYPLGCVVSWCASGACLRVGGLVEGYRALELLRRAIGSRGAATYNDSHTHAEVLAMFTKAIALAEGEA